MLVHSRITVAEAEAQHVEPTPAVRDGFTALLQLADINDSELIVNASIRMSDADFPGSSRPLWLALCRCAQLETAKGFRCNAANVEVVLRKLQGVRLALALDLYKSGHQPPLIEVVGVWTLRLALAPPPPGGARRSQGAVSKDAVPGAGLSEL